MTPPARYSEAVERIAGEIVDKFGIWSGAEEIIGEIVERETRLLVRRLELLRQAVCADRCFPSVSAKRTRHVLPCSDAANLIRRWTAPEMKP